jgi:Polyketide cyclase / dehydrase and lipid transport
MSRIHVTSERVVDAQPEVVYEVLKDYQVKRPQILTPNFLDYTVEKGGHGTGTEVRYRLRSARRERPYHIRVDEPLKGWVLRERDQNSSLVTTWTLSPENDGQRARIRVDSEWEGGTGVGGFFERTFAPFTLSRIYGKMLEMLRSQVQSAGATRVGEPSEDDKDVASSLLVVLSIVAAAAAVVTGYVVVRRLRNR